MKIAPTNKIQENIIIYLSWMYFISPNLSSFHQRFLNSSSWQPILSHSNHKISLLTYFIFNTWDRVEGDRQALRQWALRFLLSSRSKLWGTGSINTPVQFRFFSKYRELERTSPVKAPASRKNPFGFKANKTKFSCEKTVINVSKLNIT